MGLSKKTTFRYDENEISDVRTFLDNRRLALSSMQFLKSGVFIPLPFDVWRLLIDNLPETKFDLIIDEIQKIFDDSGSLENSLNRSVAWCIHVNKTPRPERFFAKLNNFKDKLEYTWLHNMGISNNNWSRIYFSAMMNSHVMNEWNVTNNNLDIGQLSITFEKR